jgi:hypothetical protein
MTLTDEINKQICASDVDCRCSQILVQRGTKLFKLESKEKLKHYNMM